MTHGRMVCCLSLLALLPLLSACERNQDQITPVGRQQGTGAAQDDPLTRNNPAAGGTNSAASGDKASRQMEAPPPAVAPSGGR